MLGRVLVTNHVLSGAVLGAGPLRRRPLAAFAAGIASHFALDRARHWGNEDPAVFQRVAVRDGLAGLTAMGAMTALASGADRWAVLAGMLGAALPDLDKPSRMFFGVSPFPRAVDEFHMRIQRESSRRMPQEFVVGGVLAATAVGLLRRRP